MKEEGLLIDHLALALVPEAILCAQADLVEDLILLRVLDHALVVAPIRRTHVIHAVSLAAAVRLEVEAIEVTVEMTYGTAALALVLPIVMPSDSQYICICILIYVGEFKIWY